MSEARSLTSLSEADYDAIAAAVMETARGRWFMTEFAKRNRQADTAQLLGAIGRIERVVGVGAPQSQREPSLSEAAALIADLRLDLERIGGRAGQPSSGLAARIETASAAIAMATEHVQEAAWSLREAGADDALCDRLDRRSTEISAATVVIDGTAQQIGKIADTIAMLDSSLRAFCESVAAAPPTEPVRPVMLHRSLDLPPAAPLSAYEDIEIVEIDQPPVSVLAQPRGVPARPMVELKLQASQILNDDIVFEDMNEPASVPFDVTPAGMQPVETRPATSEAGLRELDDLPAEAKLAYFA